jgi:hypothetical protein
MAKRPRDDVEREIMDIIPERFDADSGSMNARRSAHTRLILTIALGLLALAAVGVAIRHVLVGEGQQVAADATVPVIKPDDKPIKTKPEDRGGMAVPNQDKLVYQDVGKGEGATGAEPEKLLPPAEKPQIPAPKSGTATAAKDNAAAATMPAPASSDMPASPPAVAQSETPTAPAAAPAPSANAPVALTAPTAPSAAMSASATHPDAKKKDAAAAAKPTTVAAAAPAPAPTAPAAKPAASPASTGGGTWQVQLAAMKSEAEAREAWKKALAANKDLLGTLTEEIVQADLGARGTFYRLRAGPLDEAGAKNLCAELAKHNQACIVARK